MLYALSKINLDQVMAIILRVNAGGMILVFILSLFSLILLAFRWGKLLEAFYPTLNFFTVLKYYWQGQFLSLFLPSALSGDLARIYQFTKKHGQVVEIITVGLADKLLGFFTIGVLATSAFIWGNYFLDTKFPSYFLYLIVIFWIVILFTSLILIFASKLVVFHDLIKYFRQEIILAKFSKSFRFYRYHPGMLIGAFSASVIANLVAIIASYVAARILGINVVPLYFFMVSFLISLVLIIPISVNGFGLQDGAFVFLFSQAGINASSALSLSLILHFFRYIVYLPGGLFFLLFNENNVLFKDINHKLLNGE